LPDKKKIRPFENLKGKSEMPEVWKEKVSPIKKEVDKNVFCYI
jgi:hypothetical protein